MLHIIIFHLLIKQIKNYIEKNIKEKKYLVQK